MNNNPSPGNKAGGLTTILEKSLGAVAKGGTTNLDRRLQVRRADHRRRASSSWTRPATTRSRRPARSPAAPTSSCFTTGRGSVLRLQADAVASSWPPTPTMYTPHGRGHGHQLRRDRRRRGDASQEMGSEIFEPLLAIASGEQTKSEELGLRRRRVRALAARRGDVTPGTERSSGARRFGNYV